MPKTPEMSLGSKGKHWKLKIENESGPICLEQGNTRKFNIVNLFALSNEEYFCSLFGSHIEYLV